MSRPDNPPAFPRPSTPNGGRQDGMTLRDHFAGQALPMAWALNREARALTGPTARPTSFCAAVAADAYEMADAMLAERMKDGL